MAKFNPPYGTPDQHVPSPAHNFGYRYLVAYLVDGGMRADYIIKACAEFHEEGAPKDAFCRPDGVWKGRSQLTNRMAAQRLDSYARALTKYEQELAAERKFDSHRRST
jgi:hypothetical protein